MVERLVVISGGGAISVKHLPKELLIHVNSRSKEIPIEVASDHLLAGSAKLALSPLSPDTVFPRSFSDLPELGLDLESYITNLENHYILEALKKTSYNKNQAAKLLGMNRTTLVERIKKRKIALLNIPSKEL